MSDTAAPSEWYREFDLTDGSPSEAPQPPAEHQTEALAKLAAWYARRDDDPNGGVLVLPTGGGKTYTAVHFLCRHPLSDATAPVKVLWLAHTHHLLEQAAQTVDRLVGVIQPGRKSLLLRVVSGTPGHFPVHSIRPTDDIVVATLQTVCRAVAAQHPAIEAFLAASGGRLFIVFDEAHHSPAPSYRKLLIGLRERFPLTRILGLTATPTYLEERQRGWFIKLFPQGILHEVTASELIASKVLAQPVFEELPTDFAVGFEDGPYQEWVRTNRDLPEDIITQLAENQARNERIAGHYADNRAKYGRTIIFADRWPQCVALREMLIARGVRAGAVFSHKGGGAGTAAARNGQTEDQNREVLRRFRARELDVLVNIRMLTEGTDIPDAQSVFLTRQTTSQILLTQMVGRALRGPRFGGTERAFIVSFFDNWRHRIAWAGFGQFQFGEAADSRTVVYERPPIQLISIELVERLARQMDSGVNVNSGPYRSSLPAGWYHVTYEAVVQGTDDVETVDNLVLVFDSDEEPYRKLFAALDSAALDLFAAEALRYETVRDRVEALEIKCFGAADETVGQWSVDILAVARHMAQNDGRPPAWFPFTARDSHDLDEIASGLLETRLDRWAEDDALRAEFARADRFWGVLYHKYERFKSQYDGCVNRLLLARRPVTLAVAPPIKVRTPEAIEPRELSEAMKVSLFSRDANTCQCCGFQANNTRQLRADHIIPYYLGGGTRLDNMQTLCIACNLAKGTVPVSFRTTTTPLTTAPRTDVPLNLSWPSQFDAREMVDLDRFVCLTFNLFYRCRAVQTVDLAAKGDRFYRWTVTLFPDCDPAWFEPVKSQLVAFLRTARKDAGLQAAPDELVIG